jgi:SAM-dependent methyltransferase
VANQRFLEVGVGQGEQFQRYCSHGPRLAVGIDLTWTSARLTQLRLKVLGGKGHVVVADATKLPFREGSFDFVFSCGVLHHIPNIHGAAAEIKRALAVRGGVLVMVYNRHSYFYWVKTQMVTAARLHLVNALSLNARAKLYARRPWLKVFELPAGSKITKARIIASSTEAGGAMNPYTRFYTAGEMKNIFGNDLRYTVLSRGHYTEFAASAAGKCRSVRNVARKLRTAWSNWAYNRLGGLFLYLEMRRP